MAANPGPLDCRLDEPALHDLTANAYTARAHQCAALTDSDPDEPPPVAARDSDEKDDYSDPKDEDSEFREDDLREVVSTTAQVSTVGQALEGGRSDGS